MQDVSEQLRICDVARRTGLTVRTLRYYRGYLPLAGEEIGLLPPSDRLRERVRSVGQSLREPPDGPDERELVDVMEGLGAMDPQITQRLTLLVYEDIEAVHDHLVTVFGLGPGRLSREESGRVVHGEMLPRKREVPPVAAGVIWLHPPSEKSALASPASMGVATHCMAVMVDDVDAHYARAVAAGADVVGEPRDEYYGYREYDARDLEGGLWSFMSRLEGDDDG